MAFFSSRSVSINTLFSTAFACFLAFTSLVSTVDGLKFEIEAFKGSKAKAHERCIRHSAHQGQLVMVTATVSGYRGDGQILNIVIRDTYGNEYGRPRDVVGENRYPFTAHRDAFFDVCFENVLTSDTHGLMRHVELDVDVGADAKDWAAIQADKKLKPIEADLRRAEEIMAEVVSEMDYLTQREKRLRDTNESTNERVKWFAILSICLIIGLGVWQVVYLRTYFKSKHLI